MSAPSRVTGDVEQDNEATIRDFCAAFARRDVDELLAYFAEDATYHNMPMAPATGRAAIRSILELFVPGSSTIEFEVLAVATRGSQVFTERVDRFVMGERAVALPVAGVFELSGGKIIAWRDYFDMQAFTG